MEDDAVVGVRSTSRRFAHMPRRFVAAAYGGCVLAWVAAGTLAGLAWEYLVVLVVPIGLLGWQVRRLNINDAPGCLGLFRLNRWVGVGVVMAFVAGR